MIEKIKNAREVIWFNPDSINVKDKKEIDPLIKADDEEADISPSGTEEAAKRLERFAPLIAACFPETEKTGGIIESELRKIPEMKKITGPDIMGEVYLKMDSHLPVSGSVKARGGLYEVLKHTEDLAVSSGLLKNIYDDHMKIISPKGRMFYGLYKMQVGSTGNLGMSIGIVSAAIGYKTTVHMSKDAKRWKKELLRSKGVNVAEYEGDYSLAVESGRAQSDADMFSYFVDDEHSRDLFYGYSVAGRRLKKQLDDQRITVDEDHPLFVYLPCGVGGAPGGITYGLINEFGKNCFCIFAEPVQAPCMLLGLVSKKGSEVCVQDYGLSGETSADGLAVGRCSELAYTAIRHRIFAQVTVDDTKLDEYKKKLWKNEGIFIEPSSCAAFEGLNKLFGSKEGLEYLAKNELLLKMEGATHIVWATGGSMMPEEERGLQ